MLKDKQYAVVDDETFLFLCINLAAEVFSRTVAAAFDTHSSIEDLSRQASVTRCIRK